MVYLAVGRTAEQASKFRKLIGEHLAVEHKRYASFLRRLDVTRPDDLLDEAMYLPIPVPVYAGSAMSRR